MFRPNSVIVGEFICLKGNTEVYIKKFLLYCDYCRLEWHHYGNLFIMIVSNCAAEVRDTLLHWMCPLTLQYLHCSSSSWAVYCYVLF
jgi:hypothetical protein